MTDALLDTLREVLSPDMFTSAHLDAWSASMNYVIGQMSDLMMKTTTTTATTTILNKNTDALTDHEPLKKSY